MRWILAMVFVCPQAACLDYPFQDSAECVLGDLRRCECDNSLLADPPCDECDEQGFWVPILHEDPPCSCLNRRCREGYLCDPETERCEEECSAESCWSLAGELGVEEGDCPGVPAFGDFETYPITQTDCELALGGLVGELLGTRGCFDDRVIVTSRGCFGIDLPTGMVRFRFDCPVGDDDKESCFVTLVMLN